MKVLIPVNIYQKLRGYSQATNFEISGLGKVSLDGKDIIVEDIRIFEQEVTYASTKMDKRALAKFYDELMQKDEDISAWKLWWHSHAKMETFWSATDAATIEDFDTESDTDNWVLAIETNREDELLVRIDVFRPLRITIPKVPWEITFENKEIEDDAFSETMLKIKTPQERKRFGLNGNKKIHILGINDHDTLFPPQNKTITIVGNREINED